MSTAEQPYGTLSLLPGDNMNRAEFLHRWQAHPEIKRAELIGGVVFMPSPVTLDHGDSENNVAGWLWYYAAATPGTRASNNATALMFADAPQPDVLLRILPEAGGQSRMLGGYLSGAPEFLAEVCRTSMAYDLHQKLELYRRAGVREYLAILLFEQQIRWHVLAKDGSYRLLNADKSGVWRSRQFPGLWLNGAALLAGDMSQLLTTLQEGIARPEHARFIKKLEGKMSRR